jgi:hypothetical protein
MLWANFCLVQISPFSSCRSLSSQAQEVKYNSVSAPHIIRKKAAPNAWSAASNFLTMTTSRPRTHQCSSARDNGWTGGNRALVKLRCLILPGAVHVQKASFSWSALSFLKQSSSVWLRTPSVHAMWSNEAYFRAYGTPRRISFQTARRLTWNRMNISSADIMHGFLKGLTGMCSPTQPTPYEDGWRDHLSLAEWVSASNPIQPIWLDDEVPPSVLPMMYCNI